MPVKRLPVETHEVLTIVGNPKPASRTRTVGESVAARVAQALGGSSGTLELADLAPDLLGWGAAPVAEALEQVTAADVLVVATPVYKATYTGLLKLLFDQVGAGELGGTVAVPVMVAAGPAHALAVEVHLRPLLAEVGASGPTAGLYVLDSQLDTLDAQLDAWAALAVPAIVGTVGALRETRTVAS